jgi:hypothetical protein
MSNFASTVWKLATTSIYYRTISFMSPAEVWQKVFSAVVPSEPLTVPDLKMVVIWQRQDGCTPVTDNFKIIEYGFKSWYPFKHINIEAASFFSGASPSTHLLITETVSTNR